VLFRKSVEIKRKTRARHKIRFLQVFGREEENQEKRRTKERKGL